MATIESERAAVDRCLLDAVKSNEDPSYFENSCTGLQRFDSPINNGECAVSVPVSAKRCCYGNNKHVLFLKLRYIYIYINIYIYMHAH